MNRFLSLKGNNLIVDCDNICKYSNWIRITLNNQVLFEKKIHEKLIYDCSTLKNGENLKLYINKGGSWFFVENIFIHFNDKICLSREDILKYINNFEKKVDEIKNGYTD